MESENTEALKDIEYRTSRDGSTINFRHDTIWWYNMTSVGQKLVLFALHVMWVVVFFLNFTELFLGFDAVAWLTFGEKYCYNNIRHITSGDQPKV